MTNGHEHSKVSKRPIRVLFVAHDVKLQDYTGHLEYIAWYEGALARYCGNRVQVGVAFGGVDDPAGEVPGDTAPVSNSSITYLPLHADIGYGTTGDEWQLGRLALLEAICRFKPDIIQCLGSEWPSGAILGMTRAEINAKLDDIIRFSEIEEFIDTPIKRYSNGMLVKLGFSVAVHLENEIVIMDEVLAVGDAQFQEKCLRRLRDSARMDNRTVLYVSHNMQTVRQLCDRCIVLDQGKLIYDGDVNEAIAIYLGSGGMMPTRVEFDATHRPNDSAIRFHKWFTMESLELIGCSAPVFTSGDRAELLLQCSAAKKLERIGFRFEIWYQDGTKAGSMLTSRFATLNAGSHSLGMTVSFAHLAPGQYRTDLVAFQFDGHGGELMLDAVYPAFLFQIDPVLDKENYLTWQTTYWGITRLEDISLHVAAEGEGE